MADQRLSQLDPAALPLTGTELAYVVQSGGQRRTTAAALAAVLPEATTTTAGKLSAADKALLSALVAAGLEVTPSGAVVIPHIHGDVAGTIYFHVKNTSGGPLTKGAPVSVVGAVGDTTTLEVVATDPSTPGRTRAQGLLYEDLASNAEGHAVILGELTGVNTAAFTPSSPLWVGATGGTTGTRPASAAQEVATVGRQHASTGTLLVAIQGVEPTAAQIGAAVVGRTAPANLAATASAGTSDEAAPIDHVHRFPDTTVVIPLSGEAANLTVTTLLTVPRWPESRTLTALPLWMVNTAPAGSVAQFDIRVGGTSIFSTLPTIDATEQGSDTAAVAGVFSAAFVAAGHVIAQGSSVAFLCTQIGSTTAGAGVKVALPSRRV